VTEQTGPEGLPLAGGLFGSVAWWRAVVAHAMPAGSAASFVAVRVGGQVAAVVPMLRLGRRLDGLTTPYTCVFVPFVAGEAAAMVAFARFCGAHAVVRLDAIPAEWEGLGALLAGARAAGLVALRFDHFGNWFEDVTGLDWAGYLERRPGALRETIKRRLRRAERLAGAAFAVLTRPEEMDAAVAAYGAVYARSWKEPEPYPSFNAALMRAMAAEGTLRFGLWSIDGTAVAVQLWGVLDMHAVVLKLAHDEAYKAHSPGTVLTALMLRHLLETEGVAEIDFGRGDDAYKRGWASSRRQRVGVLLVNPWRLAGAAVLVLHAAGWLRRFVSGLRGATAAKAGQGG
jgi:hypothetical protein